MRTIEDLRSEVIKLEDQIRALEGTVITVDGLTVRDITALSQKLDSLKKELNEPIGPPSSSTQRSKYFREYAMQPDSKKPSVAPPAAPPRKSRFTEGNIGRYGVGILASILILLAVGTAASAFWQYIPNEVKFVFFLILGIVCEGFGWKQLQKSSIRNGFWTSLTGLGAAISFVSIVLGDSMWYLYPTIFTDIALITWFAANFILSAKANSKVFYIITYIGGIIAATLTAAALTFSGGSRMEKELLLIAMTVVIYGIGKFGALKTKNNALPVLNMVFLWSVFYQIQSLLPMAGHSEAVQSFCAQYIPGPLIPFQVIIATAILLEAANAWAKDWGYAGIGTAILSFLASATVATAAQTWVNFCGVLPIISNTAEASLLIVAIVGACGVAYRKKWNQYILGVSPVTAAALAFISRCVFGYDPVLPALLVILLVALPIFRRDKYVKLAAVILYLMAFNGVVSIYNDPPSQVFVYIGLFLLMLVPALNYILICMNQDGFFPELEQLGGVIFPALAFRRMAIEFGGCGMLWIGVLVMLSFGHKYFVPNKQLSASRDERDLAKIISSIITVWICLCCYVGGLIMPTFTDKVIATVLLVLYSALSTYKAAGSKSVAWTVFSVIFSNFNLFYVVCAWNGGNANIMVSCFGLMLSAVLIGIGFWKKKKPMRVAGLATMMTYVLKIALVDIAETGDMGRRVLVLLLGGIVCFGVSFAYNKLDKLYGNVEEAASETK